MVARLGLLMILAVMPRWVHVKDAMRTHERYVERYPDGTASLLGEYYEVQPGDVRAVCAGGDPRSFATSDLARAFVLACPR